MFFRRQILEDMNGFDVGLGMIDKKLAYGEETELQRRIRETTPKAIIYYDPRLFVYHLVRLEKMKLRWILSSRFADGYCSLHVFETSKIMSFNSATYKLKLLSKVMLLLLKFVVDCLVGVLGRDRERYPYLQNYLYENTSEYVMEFGKIYEEFTRGVRRVM